MSMTIYNIEVDKDLDRRIQENANAKNLSAEKFITYILNRYIIDVHIMENKDVEEGYKECGDINLELASL